jgi:hypothetical protein
MGAMQLLSCNCHPHRFDRIGSVTRVRVTDSYADTKVNKIINSPEDISRIVEFVDSERDGWGCSWADVAGTRMPRLKLEFYEGDRVIKHFGVGKSFFWSLMPYATTKSVPPQRVQSFLVLIGISEEVIKPISRASQ